MKMLSSVILTLVLFVTLSSIHTADGLKCYECAYEIGHLDMDHDALLRQGKAADTTPDPEEVHQLRGRTCPSDHNFQAVHATKCRKPRNNYPPVKPGDPENKMVCAKYSYTFQNIKSKENSSHLAQVVCEEVSHDHKPGTCFDKKFERNFIRTETKSESIYATAKICTCDKDLCNKGSKEDSGSSSIKSGLFSLWPAAFIPLVMYSFGVLGSPSS